MGSEKIKTCIYARVSTKEQEYDRQLAELREYADRMGYEVVREFSEKISGAKKVEEREALLDLLDYVSAHPVDKVLIYECSRLSRRAVDFLSVIETLTAQKVSVYIHQNGLETLSPNGAPNPIAQLVLGVLAQFNSMERSLIRSRMESGYNHFRSLGGKVGRKAGYRKSVLRNSMQSYSEQALQEQTLLKKRMTETENAIQRLKVRLALGEIPSDVYEAGMQELQARKDTYTLEMEQWNVKISNCSQMTPKIIVTASNISSLWKSGSLEIKRRIQNLVFPEGILWDKGISDYRTPKTGGFFEIMSRFSDTYIKTKETSPCELVSLCGR